MNLKYTCDHCAEYVGLDYIPPLTPVARCFICHGGPSDMEVLAALVGKGLLGTVQPEESLNAGTGAAPSGDWLTTAEVCTLFRFRSHQAVYAAARRGDLPFQRIGKRGMRFSRKAIEAAMAARVPPDPRSPRT